MYFCLERVCFLNHQNIWQKGFRLYKNSLETIASYELSMQPKREEKWCQQEIKLREYHVSSSIRIICEERATRVTENGWWAFTLCYSSLLPLASVLSTAPNTLKSLPKISLNEVFWAWKSPSTFTSCLWEKVAHPSTFFMWMTNSTKRLE